MYARITPYRVAPGRETEVIRIGNEESLPATRRMAGFRGFLGTADPNTGRGYSITLWETREQAEGYRVALAGPILQRIQDLGVQFEPVQIQEVLGQEWPTA